MGEQWMIFPRLRLLPVYLDEGTSLAQVAKWTKQLLLVRKCTLSCASVLAQLQAVGAGC